jgi:hypothetical protein
VRKLTLKDMYVGIVTARNSKSKFTNDVISYLGVDGEIWDGKPQEVKIGEGFKQDDVVQVLIRDNEIVWKVNGKL